jgi:hypothetical protein
MNSWIGTSRYVYNRSLDAIKEENNLNFYDLRNRFVTAKNNPNVKEWELDTPKDIRAGAIRDLIKARTTAFSNLNNGNISKFKLGYRKKKKSSSIEIPKSAIKIADNKLFIYKTYTKEEIKLSKDKSLLNIEIDYDCRLKNENGKWYIIIPVKTNMDNEIYIKLFDMGEYEKSFVINTGDKVLIGDNIYKLSCKFTNNKYNKSQLMCNIRGYINDSFNILNSDKITYDDYIINANIK